MYNLFSYCGLVDAKIKASDKDLPVPNESKSAIGRLKMNKGAEIPTLKTIANTPNQETYVEKNNTERILKNVETKSLPENKISTENVSATLTERNLANLKPLMLLANHTQQIILKINPFLSNSNGTDKNQITKKSVHEKKKPKPMVDKIATEICVSGPREIENIKQENISDDIIQVNLFQKHLFLYQLTHNMTKDCSLNYKFST